MFIDFYKKINLYNITMNTEILRNICIYFCFCLMGASCIAGQSLAAQTTNSDSICVAAGYVLSLAPINVSCSGASDGTASVASTGCTCMFSGCTYQWSSGATTHTATDLAPGVYGVTVTHPNGCVIDTSLVITEPSPFVQSINIQNATCKGMNDGAASVIPSTSSGPLTYLWSDGQTSATLTGLAAGDHSVTVTNFINCQYIETITIAEPTQLSASIVAQPSCGNSNDGSMEISITGGTPPYICALPGMPNLMPNNVVNLAPGNYSLTVSDANQCQTVKNTTIQSINAPQPTISAWDNTICPGESTQIIAIVPGGASFSWSPTTGLSNPNSNAPTAAPTQTTTYTVTALNAATGCTGSAQITITVDLCNNVSVPTENQSLLLTPNPAKDHLYLALQLEKPMVTIQVRLFNTLGQTIYQHSEEADNNLFAKTIDLRTIANGIYIAEVMAGQHIWRERVVIGSH